MGFYESKWLNEYNPNKAKFCLRYGYGILAAFHNVQDSLNFLNFINNRQPNIKFTISIIKISHFKHIRNRPIQDFFSIVRVSHHSQVRLV